MLGLALLGGALLAGPAMAQTAPGGAPGGSPGGTMGGSTARIVAGFAPGGTSDIMARLVAEAVSQLLGQRVIVENRTGANGFIAAEAVARGPADGSALFQCPMGTMTISPELPGLTLPIDVRTELVPVANVALSRYAVVAGPRGPYHSLADFIAAARRQPDTLSYASAGAGSAQHLAGERLARLAGLRLIHVPYRGAAPAALDVMAGRADLLITNLGDVVRQIQGGELRLLALGDAAPSPDFPDVARLPAIVPGLEVVGWFGLCGPRGLPAEASQRWSEAVRRALEDPALRRKLGENGLTPQFEDQDAFGRRMEADRRLWRDTIRDANIRVD
ncbi:tripartite tricarboxylate transporter substrate binding protein [Roseomonas sp. NAR14]|uniref:Tripartite tricarboxylate transporter substrate binding protein n=1 Tax=Roseomonas acroporae TaxID=2937791 RepID=A0A9X1YBL2_9PROT|nr:tripartite tricarboxylate transporter substrate binding protein [Roseomonas acroporae]MCK8785960.1 tripartite tricarboxylate transporter substrate binding protein [Roseomonas acroporae]